MDFFDSLEQNDILLIDSSYVSKPGSDVNYYLFEIFPRIKAGVYIHIHDIFYPMEYPKDWITEESTYNEMFILRSFLMYNTAFSVRFFGEQLLMDHYDELPNNMYNIKESIWLKKE